ncbi:AcrR family transcriptional regulator [Amycolatopsis bartoniae]|uniref:TetR family transcriptional regulator n=1 Tax=Amycolatopsis bartoniae TaxID=941986 RepID=A0A8H9M7R0_9PSEU|nr:TetR/AcrR family transcriptional regulator [Amycolatopsis bartoniae]MBB2939961.1 AcrR family transcriptional regulator [Amycolatopsis bartoniae]TVT10135.1 TetR/AcrR family transcriptional regulator [Amycolatopsis bartoniae]GHF35462.1 TetR family transcriptional regulator [Amycolatopsis bartoniae]
MVSRGRRGAYKVGVVRRAKIVETAADRFARDGYRRTSMAQIAEDAEITDSGLLHHFPSKQHLLLAVVQHRMSDADQWWEQADPQAGAVATLARMVEATRRYLSRPGLIELFVHLMSEAAEPSSAAHTLYSRQYENVVAAIAERFRFSVSTGDVHADLDCDALARECIAVSDGLQLQWVLTEGRLDLAGAIRSHADRLARSITTDGSGLPSEHS